ncbi:MAG: hypothetical protein IH957_10585 [Chloroflexi bacterium]|nr:hypothetical protein [Chloroflexota bacterium]
MEDSVDTGEKVLNVVLDRIKTSGRVEIIYGESREMHGKTIIPIAAVAYGFGAGAGSGSGVDHSLNGGGGTGTGGGGGGGGAVRVQPVGVLEVTDDETRLVPIMDWTRIITTGLTFFGVWMVVRAIFKR